MSDNRDSLLECLTVLIRGTGRGPDGSHRRGGVIQVQGKAATYLHGRILISERWAKDWRSSWAKYLTSGDSEWLLWLIMVLDQEVTQSMYSFTVALISDGSLDSSGQMFEVPGIILSQNMPRRSQEVWTGRTSLTLETSSTALEELGFESMWHHSDYTLSTLGRYVLLVICCMSACVRQCCLVGGRHKWGLIRLLPTLNVWQGTFPQFIHYLAPGKWYALRKKVKGVTAFLKLKKQNK